jgi:hypothetical protein
LGLAIGLSLGIPLLLIAGIIFAFKIFNYRREVRESEIPHGSVADATATDPGANLHETFRPMSIPELPGSGKAHELASGSM